MTAITESIQNGGQPGSVPQEELKHRENSGEDILAGANETDQLDRLHPDEKKNREEAGSPPVEHVDDGSPEDAHLEGSDGSSNAQ
ncbi:hypothetical protein [Arcticibacter sp.]|uniref:hypothetical protein n=1 Tax=Arcticibacter sp. TaxID=1872630 RepID=UPI00388F5BB3